MAQQSKGQKETVGRVMHEYKHGELKTGGAGPKVKNPKQAIAIALHEAGASRDQSENEQEKSFRRTKEKERKGETAEAESEGKRRKIARCAADPPPQTAVVRTASRSFTPKPNAGALPAARQCPSNSWSGRSKSEGRSHRERQAHAGAAPRLCIHASARFHATATTIGPTKRPMSPCANIPPMTPIKVTMVGVAKP